ncbi:hypothetical protein ACGF07_00615 [Kitasatospora sp. NPDC048194]|uniref:hypothetical protein n=1 Tax=Kitasatospora sp. NPDC048194 TaxID=3364045 RepID=UPI003712AD7A
MNITITPVTLAKAATPAMSAEETIANLTERNFELGRLLDAARAEIARRDLCDDIWTTVFVGLIERIEELELMAGALDVAVFKI